MCKNIFIGTNSSALQSHGTQHKYQTQKAAAYTQKHACKSFFGKRTLFMHIQAVEAKKGNSTKCMCLCSFNFER